MKLIAITEAMKYCSEHKQGIMYKLHIDSPFIYEGVMAMSVNEELAGDNDNEYLSIKSLWDQELTHIHLSDGKSVNMYGESTKELMLDVMDDFLHQQLI